MNRNILKKLLAEAANRSVVPEPRDRSERPAGKNRRSAGRMRSNKNKQANQATANPRASLSSKSPMFKAKKMKLAAQKAAKRHQMMKEENTEDRKANQQLKGSQYVLYLESF